MEFTWSAIVALIISTIHVLSDRILEFFLGIILGSHRRVATPQSVDQRNILTKSAVELARNIRERKLSSYEIVKAFCERIQSVNGDLNAVVDGPFEEEALQQAKEIDEKLAKDEYTPEELEAKPFLGVPFTTKDSNSVAGKLHTLGLISRRNTRSEQDAKCVRLIKESGAIILATTNIPDNKWVETTNMLVGKTNNPYDLRRTVGASSGGEAALIAGCCTGFGLGTDIGGSIRIPAFSCGVFGHKPTALAVNMAGCNFGTGQEKETMAVAGPMSRHAEDLLPIMKILLEPNLRDSFKLDAKVDVKKLRYFYIPSNGMKACNPINHDTERVMFKLRKHFESLTGQPVHLAKLPHLELSGKMWRYWMTQEPDYFNEVLESAPNPFVELVRKLLGRSDYSMGLIYALIDGVLPKENEALMRQATKECKQALQDILGDNGVLLYHSSPRTAPYHYYPLVKFSDFNYFSLFNALRLPVTQVPMGLDSNGMPLGIQVVASEKNDRLCFAVAEELERAFGGWAPPFSIEN